MPKNQTQNTQIRSLKLNQILIYAMNLSNQEQRVIISVEI